MYRKIGTLALVAVALLAACALAEKTTFYSGSHALEMEATEDNAATTCTLNKQAATSVSKSAKGVYTVDFGGVKHEYAVTSARSMFLFSSGGAVGGVSAPLLFFAPVMPGNSIHDIHELCSELLELYHRYLLVTLAGGKPADAHYRFKSVDEVVAAFEGAVEHTKTFLQGRTMMLRDERTKLFAPALEADFKQYAAAAKQMVSLGVTLPMPKSTLPPMIDPQKAIDKLLKDPEYLKWKTAPAPATFSNPDRPVSAAEKKLGGILKKVGEGIGQVMLDEMQLHYDTRAAAVKELPQFKEGTDPTLYDGELYQLKQQIAELKKAKIGETIGDNLYRSVFNRENKKKAAVNKADAKKAVEKDGANWVKELVTLLNEANQGALAASQLVNKAISTGTLSPLELTKLAASFKAAREAATAALVLAMKHVLGLAPAPKEDAKKVESKWKAKFDWDFVPKFQGGQYKDGSQKPLLDSLEGSASLAISKDKQSHVVKATIKTDNIFNGGKDEPLKAENTLHYQYSDGTWKAGTTASLILAAKYVDQKGEAKDAKTQAKLKGFLTFENSAGTKIGGFVEMTVPVGSSDPTSWVVNSDVAFKIKKHEVGVAAKVSFLDETWNGADGSAFAKFKLFDSKYRQGFLKISLGAKSGNNSPLLPAGTDAEFQLIGRLDFEMKVFEASSVGLFYEVNPTWLPSGSVLPVQKTGLIYTF